MNIIKRILIVDDSQLNREMLMEILGDEYIYSCAGDGETALAMLSANLQIDILLLDMQMPGMNGVSRKDSVSNFVETSRNLL